MGAKADKRTQATVEAISTMNADCQKQASKTILKLGTAPASGQTSSFKLQDTMGNEVKERLDNWRDGEDARILLDMLIKSIGICNTYILTL